MDYLVYNLAELSPTPEDAALLSCEESEQAAARGARFTLIRTLLKRELSRRTGVPPQQIRFSRGPHGKPFWAPQPFNISHSGDLLCLAFHHGDVGVDIERIRPRTRLLSLATRIMAPEQFEAFTQRGCLLPEFFACWCTAEALVKHAGDTLWNARSYPFLYLPPTGADVAPYIRPLFPSPPHIHLFSPAPTFAGAVVFS